MFPSVGRIVHYTNLGDKDGKYPPEQQAAIITGCKEKIPCEECGQINVGQTGECFCPQCGLPRTWDNDIADLTENHYVVDLHIFYRTGDFYMLDVPYSIDYARGHWSWPAKV